jgi:hypothetical protein
VETYGKMSALGRTTGEIIGRLNYFRFGGVEYKCDGRFLYFRDHGMPVASAE